MKEMIKESEKNTGDIEEIKKIIRDTNGKLSSRKAKIDKDVFEYK
jgi:hypothetical protein